MKPLGSLAAAVLMLTVSADRTSAQATPRTAGGCPLDPVKFHECALPKTKTFNPPRTADGRPDMQGYWDRAFTSQDVEEHGADGLNIQPGPSLVVDTPDHKIPYQPWALEFRKNIVDRFISPLASCCRAKVSNIVRNFTANARQLQAMNGMKMPTNKNGCR